MKLFIYELKKNVLKASLLILLAAFLLIDVYKLFENLKTYYRMDYDAVTKTGSVASSPIYDEFGGDITPESIQRVVDYHSKMDKIISSGNYTTTPSDEYYTRYAFSDWTDITRFEEAMREAYLYPNDILELRQNADDFIEFYTGRNNYEVNKNQLIKSLYVGRKIPAISQYKGYSLYFDYEFSSLLIILMIVFAFAPTFVKEKSTGTDRIIRSCRRTGSVFWAKHCSMYIMIFAATVVFSLVDLGFYGMLYGFDNLNMPLYAMTDYRFTPFAVTIGGGILLSFIGKLAAYLFVGEAVMCISTIGKNIGGCIAGSLAAIMGLVLLSEHIPSCLSPINLVNMKNQLSQFAAVRIFDIPVPAPIFTFALTVILTAALHIICRLRTVKKVRGGAA